MNKTAQTKTPSTAAVMPLVNSKEKTVFLKVVQGNADRSIKSVENALQSRKLSGLSGDTKDFVKQQGIERVTLWTSRISKVKPGRVDKSFAVQTEFWKGLGYNVANAEGATA